MAEAVEKSVIPAAEEAKLREKLDAVKADVSEIAKIARDLAGQRLSAARDRMSGVETWAGEHPAATLGVGIGVGFLVGLVVGRATK